MRPSAKSDVGSTAGFLAPQEKLRDVLVVDSQNVVDELCLTHQELAKHLHPNRSHRAMAGVGAQKARVRVRQPRPAIQSDNAGLERVSAVAVPGRDPEQYRRNGRKPRRGKKLTYGLLVPYMIERYGFYEGKGTSYRVDPRQVVEVFDFSTAKKKKD